ncbi:unnamed protein product [Rotaria sp. Silwood1]|nr:unnamed protein product [Rotaria sp. Silwood1]CAF4665623.1 unnamed protein product [Rotaria sp. Silwood1]
MPTNDDLNKLPMHQKRWTFNTWRLHGRRQLSNGEDAEKCGFWPECPLWIALIDLYLPTTSLLSSLNDQQYEIFDDAEDDARKTHEHLSQFFQK